MTSLRADSSRASSAAYGSLNKQPAPENCDASRPSIGDHDAGHHKFVFIIKDMPKELKARQPDVHVSVVRHIADAFGIRKGTQVLLTPVSRLGLRPRPRG